MELRGGAEGAVGQGAVRGGTEGEGAAEGAGESPAVRVVVLGGALIIPEAVTPSMHHGITIFLSSLYRICLQTFCIPC